MKKMILISLAGLLMINFTYGQEISATEALTKLSTIKDQHKKNFDPADVPDEVTFIFIEGTNTVVTDIYSKFPGKKPLESVRLVGGWKNVMPNFEYDKKFDHLKDIFTDASYPVLIDINSETLKLLNLGRYSIVTISKKDKRVDVKNYGSDRVAFLKEMEKLYQ